MNYWQGFKILWTIQKQEVSCRLPAQDDPKATLRHYMEFHFSIDGSGKATKEAHFALKRNREEVLCELVLDNEQVREEVLKELERRAADIAKGLGPDINPSDITCAFHDSPRRLYVKLKTTSDESPDLNKEYAWMLDLLKRFYLYFPKVIADVYQTLGIKPNREDGGGKKSTEKPEH